LSASYTDEKIISTTVRITALLGHKKGEGAIAPHSGGVTMASSCEQFKRDLDSMVGGSGPEPDPEITTPKEDDDKTETTDESESDKK
jgi:hypothetical protein